MEDKKKYITDKNAVIRKGKKDFFISNIFSVPGEILSIKEEENGIAFLVSDNGVKRAYFSCSEIDSIYALMEDMPKDTGVEIIDRELNSMVSEVLGRIGFEHFATYLRASNKDLVVTYDKNIPDRFQNIKYEEYARLATLEDVDQIYCLLYETFNPLTSHLQNIEELRNDILRKGVRISVNRGMVEALLTYKFQGKKLYMEHMVNRGESILMHSLYFPVLKYAVEHNVNYAYTWMRDDNGRALAFAKRYGIIPDGIRNYVFIKKM